MVGQNAVENNSLITQRSDGNKYYTKEDDKYNLLQYLVATNQLTPDQVPNSIFKDLENTETTFTLDDKKLNTPKSEDFEKSFYDEIKNGSVISKEKYLELMNKNPEVWAEVKDAIETKQFWEGVKDPVFQYVIPGLQLGGGIGQIAVAGGVDVVGCATVVACGVAVGGSSLLIANGLDDIRTGWNNLGTLPIEQTASSTLTSLGVSEGTAEWIKLGAGGASIGTEALVINKGLNTTISPVVIVENASTSKTSNSYGSNFAENSEQTLQDLVKINVELSQAAREESNFDIHIAKSDQIQWGYKADEWSVTDLKKGDYVYGGLPGQSSYYTTERTIEAANKSATSLFESLQVQPHPIFGYRSEMGKYELLADIKVPNGEVKANPNLGIGGGDQFFIKDFNKNLKLVDKISLEK